MFVGFHEELHIVYVRRRVSFNVNVLSESRFECGVGERRGRGNEYLPIYSHYRGHETLFLCMRNDSRQNTWTPQFPILPSPRKFNFIPGELERR